MIRLYFPTIQRLIQFLDAITGCFAEEVARLLPCPSIWYHLICHCIQLDHPLKFYPIIESCLGFIDP